MNYQLFYQGNLRVRCVHESGFELLTDAPRDNQGQGEAFSPTDLIAVGLASCMLTLMGIAARKLGFDLSGATARVQKEMVAYPHRRIGAIRVEIWVPRDCEPTVREKLEQAAAQCPVHHSLHPEVRQELVFRWGG